MICPKCGSPNDAAAGECSHCHYKFRFGHAWGDPSKMIFVDSPSASSSEKKDPSFRNIAVGICVIAAVLLLFLAILRSLFQ